RDPDRTSPRRQPSAAAGWWSPPRYRSALLKQRNRADRACGAAADLQRETDEAEAAPADDLFQVRQAFHVGDAAFGAGHVREEIQLALRRRADCLHTEHADAAV